MLIIYDHMQLWLYFIIFWKSDCLGLKVVVIYVEMLGEYIWSAVTASVLSSI
jgi:hypothetical protein